MLDDSGLSSKLLAGWEQNHREWMVVDRCKELRELFEVRANDEIKDFKKAISQATTSFQLNSRSLV